eukprot:SAG31_NODE_6425_length_2025_cov_0.957425_2_plen_229_part_00
MRDAAAVLAKYLEHSQKCHGQAQVLGKVVLELGSGAGLVGIMARKLGAARVICTEYSLDQPVLALLHHNIAANASIYTAPGEIYARTLDWGQPLPELVLTDLLRPLSTARDRAKADVITDVLPAPTLPDLWVLAADVLYTEDDLEDEGLAKPLLSTLGLLASTVCGRQMYVVLAWEETTARAAAPLQAFWAHLSAAGFSAVMVPKAELDVTYRRDGIHVSILQQLPND